MRKALCLSALVNVPQIIAIVAIFAWATYGQITVSEGCDLRYLELWLCLHALRLTLMLVLQGVLYLSRSLNGRQRENILSLPLRTLRAMGPPLALLGIGFLMWIDDECKDDQHPIYKLALWLVVLNVCIALLPVLLLLLLLPLVCFCLPGLLRVLNALEEPQTPDPEQRRREIEARFPARKYQKRREQGQEDCTICLQPFEEGESVRVMSCSPMHLFHAACIDPWLRRQSTCPICRRALFESRRGDDEFDDEQVVRINVNEAESQPLLGGSRQRVDS